MELIKGKVAKIQDSYTVVINKGAIDEVEDGMRFVIYEKGQEIKDPETEESLGFLENVKVKVRVYHVQEKICTAKTYETTSPLSGLYAAMSGSIATVEELPLDEQSRKTLMRQPTQASSGVKVGDLVKQIIE